MTTRRRRKDQKAGVFGIALVITGALEAFDLVDDGENVLEAAGKAVRRTKRRAEILAETERRIAGEEKRRRVRG